MFSPLELSETLAALVPPPRGNRKVYPGVLGARSAWVRAIVPKTEDVSQLSALQKQVAVRRPLQWAEMVVAQ